MTAAASQSVPHRTGADETRGLSIATAAIEPADSRGGDVVVQAGRRGLTVVDALGAAIVLEPARA
jgi:hypothetical protein